MENVKILNIEYEVIECLDFHILVQDPITKEKFLTEYQNIDSMADVKYTEGDGDSNIVSIRSWKLCQKRTNIKDTKGPSKRLRKPLNKAN